MTMDVLLQFGLFDENLLRNTFDEVPEKFCTNEIMITLHDKSKVLAPKESLSRFCLWTSLLFGICRNNISTNGLLSKINRTVNQMRKKRGEDRLHYLNDRFDIPIANLQSSTNYSLDVTQLVTSELIECESALVKSEETVDRKRQTLSSVRETSKQMKRKLQRMESKVERCSKRLCTAKEAEKKVAVLERQVLRMRGKVAEKESSNKELRRKLRFVNSKLKEKSMEIEEAYKANKALSLINSSAQSEMEKILETRKEDLSHMKQLRENNDYLQTLLCDNESLETFDEDKNCCKSNMVECIMNITNCNVAENKVAEIIKHVCNLCGKKPTKLPSERTVNRINQRKGSIALKQLETVASHKNLTLYTDETSKFGTTFEVFAVTDAQHNSYLLGLREMMNKSASSVLDTFKSIITDIDHTCEHSVTSAGTKILSRIKNTMSDRAATERRFQELLETYRKELLPLIIDDWNSLSEEERLATSKLNNFFCGLHLLVGCADVASLAMRKYEHLHKSASPFSDQMSGQTGESEFQSSESGTLRLIRCASKAFARGSDEKSGVHGPWKTFVESNEQKVLFFPFKHNRFNIVFLLGGVLYYHRHRIAHFLENVHGITNRLLQQISTDLKNEVFIAGCRALGLLSKQVTSPLWRLIEGELHILEMNKQYLDLCEFLEKMKDQSFVLEFMCGKQSPFDTDIEEGDAVHKELVSSCENDEQTAAILQVLCESMISLLKRQLADQLPGGKFANYAEELKSDSCSTLKHNKLPEFFFGQLDFLLRYRPNASTLCNESFLMFSHNKTGDWLKSLPEDEKHRLLEDSRKHGQLICSTFKKRLADIKAEREVHLKKKEEAIKVTRERNLKRKESLTNLITFYGLWQSENEVIAKLSEIQTVTERRKALQTQLNFRKLVLIQKSGIPHVFSFSEKIQSRVCRVPIAKLESNLKQLIKESYQGPQEECQTHPDQPLLVGKYIEHKFDDGQRYRGKVISTVPGYPSWYNLKYDDDEDLYVYDLLVDYRAGDLVILV